MTSVICFNLVPESIEYSGMTGILLGVFIGVFMMILCNDFVNKKLVAKTISIKENKIDNSKLRKIKYKNANLLKVGLVVGIGLAIHNFPERISYRFWF